MSQVIGISGAAGSGKSTVGEILVDLGAGTLTPMAGSLKVFVATLLTGLNAQLKLPDGSTRKPPFVGPDFESRDLKRATIHLEPETTARRLLQVGGDASKAAFGDTIFVDTALKDLKPGGSAIVPDIRFAEEWGTLKERFGRAVRVQVERPGLASDLTGAETTHASELGTGLPAPDVTLFNATTIEELREKVELLVPKPPTVTPTVTPPVAPPKDTAVEAVGRAAVKVWRNPHKRHDLITFQEDVHEYRVNGHKVPLSVTGVKKELTEPFDSKKVATRMVEKIASFGTVVDGNASTGITFVPSSPAEVLSALVEKGRPMKGAEADLAKQLEHRVNYCRKCTLGDGRSALRTLSVSVIMKRWREKGEAASKSGTISHGLMEAYGDGHPVMAVMGGPNEYKNAQSRHWVELMLRDGYEMYETEAVIWGIGPNAEANDGSARGLLAGSVDVMMRKKDGPRDEVYLFDYKYSDKPLDPNFRNTFRRMKVIPELYDCTDGEWCLQINLYRYMLERYYGLKVKGMAMVSMTEKRDMPVVVKYDRVDMTPVVKHIESMNAPRAPVKRKARRKQPKPKRVCKDAAAILSSMLGNK